MLSRIVREAFQSFEFREDGEDLKKRCLRLGEAILKPMIESIKEVSENQKVVEKYRLRFNSLEIFELFKEHLRRMGVDAGFSEPVEEEGTYVVYMEKYMMGTTDKISHILKGNLW
jgi:putative ATP-dependent DNA ligase